MSGEAQPSAKYVGFSSIVTAEGAKLVLAKLDELYKVGETTQLDRDLAEFLDYRWSNKQSIEPYIAGFFTRLDKIAPLQLDGKLKGHLLLRNAHLNEHSRNMVFSASFGKYDAASMTRAVRTVFHTSNVPDTLPGYLQRQPRRMQPRTEEEVVDTVTKKITRAMLSNTLVQQLVPVATCRATPNFVSFAFNKNDPIGESSRSVVASPTTEKEMIYYTSYASTSDMLTGLAIFNSGASSSVVGKDTLNSTMAELEMEKIDRTTPRQNVHNFGNSTDVWSYSSAVMFPFECSTMYRNKDSEETVNFRISFDVFDGDLHFLFGLPTLKGMRASLIF